MPAVRAVAEKFTIQAAKAGCSDASSVAL
jgi:hypothetical protein